MDVQVQQYLEMVAGNERLLPVEVRILKILFNTPDPKYREYVLEKAFKPPPLTWDATQSDDLYTTPVLLYDHINTMLQTFDQVDRAKGGVGLGQVLPGTEHEAVPVMGGYQGI